MSDDKPKRKVVEQFRDDGVTRRGELHQFVKGVSGNPLGRPKGIKNKSTLAQEALDTVITYENPLKAGEMLKCSVENLLCYVLAGKGLAGDLSSIREIYDMRYGKTPDKQEISEEITITVGDVDDEKQRLLEENEYLKTMLESRTVESEVVEDE